MWKEALETANHSREAPYSFLGETPCEHRVTPCPLDYLPGPEAIPPGGTATNSAYAHPIGAIVSGRRLSQPKPPQSPFALLINRYRNCIGYAPTSLARAFGPRDPIGPNPHLKILLLAARAGPRYPAAGISVKEKRMRRFVSAVAALTMLSTQPVLAERQCSSLADQSAFEVQALRSELVVLATGCHDDEQYNAFIRRYQPDLQTNERIISAYFQHRYGKAGQTEHDRFVTELANTMSRQGSDLGGDFCPRNGLIFNEVLALQSAAELADFAAGKSLMPGSVPVCTPMPSSAVAVRKAAAVVTKKK
jgi:hypothetical protein